MFDANASREDQERMVFEQEIHGKEVLNVIACEWVEATSIEPGDCQQNGPSEAMLPQGFLSG